MKKLLQWNDPDININWPINKPIMSHKDKNNSQSFKNYLIYKMKIKN